MIEENVQAIVERVVKTRLQSTHVVSVHASRGEDFDGDDIIRVTIVVDGPASSFDPARLAGLVRHLQDSLADEANEHDYPMVSYMTRREFDRVPA